jgi:hypothetical protein
MQALAAGEVRTDSKNPKAPNTRQYGQQIAKRMFDLLPMGSAQAAPAQAAPAQAAPAQAAPAQAAPAQAAPAQAAPAQAAPAQAAPAQAAPAPAEDAPSIYSGPGFTPEGLEALGQRLDVIREARSKAKPVSLRERNADPDAAKRFEALQNLNAQSQQEYERYAAGLGLDKPAFAAQSAGGKGVGTTTLPQVQAVARAAAAAAAPAPEDGADTGQSETTAYRGKSGDADQDIGPLTPAIKKEAVALAKAEIPKEERKGFGYEDLLMFGLQLLAGKSQYALQNVGEAGVAALSAKQAREKAAIDQKKEAAMTQYYEKYGNYLDSEGSRKAAEDKPQMQYQKAIDKAIAELKDDPQYKFAKTPAEKTQMENNARETVKASFLSVYPELAGTMKGAGPLLDLTQWGTPIK